LVEHYRSGKEAAQKGKNKMAGSQKPGRPPLDVTTVPVHALLTVEQTARLDVFRAELTRRSIRLSRSDLLRVLLEPVLEVIEGIDVAQIDPGDKEAVRNAVRGALSAK
jgi:hypothetical protein